MAKKTKKKKMLPLHQIWQAEPDDAIRLAALRWFALQIERLGIEIYATDKSRYAEIEKILRTALSRMAGTKKDLSQDEESECPEGFILCKDGFCAPMCDGISGDSSPEYRDRGRSDD